MACNIGFWLDQNQGFCGSWSKYMNTAQHSVDVMSIKVLSLAMLEVNVKKVNPSEKVKGSCQLIKEPVLLSRLPI